MAAELDASGRRPGAVALGTALDEGWLQIEDDVGSLPRLPATLDEGETQAITLAHTLRVPLLIDESRGRPAARRVGVRVIGTGGILILAKRRGLLDRVVPALDDLQANGYRLSDPLCRQILRLAGESEEP